MYDLDLIVECRNKLKFVALLDIDTRYTHVGQTNRGKYQGHIRTPNFGVIIYSRIDGLKMTFNSKTLEIEGDCEKCKLNRVINLHLTMFVGFHFYVIVFGVLAVVG